MAVDQFKPASLRPRPVEIRDFKKSDAISKPSKRRQLTVRIDMDKFEQLDRLAKLSGQTYQDIQSKALAAYLRANENDREDANENDRED